MTYLNRIIALSFFILGLPLCVLAGSSEWSAIAEVDVDEVLNKYTTYQQRKQECKKYKNRLRQQLHFQRQKVSSRLGSLSHNLKGQSIELSKQQSLLRKRQIVLRARRKRIEGLIKEKEEEIREKAYDRISQVVQTISEELQLPIVIRGEAGTRRNQILAPTRRNLTNRVLKELN